MRPNLPFLTAASNDILKPGGLLKWKKRLVKNARISLPLTEVMKIARLTSPLLGAPRQSSPRPRRRHGRRLALLSHLNLTLNLCTPSFVLSLALLPPLLTSPTVPLPENRLRSSPITCDPTFPFPSQGYFSELCRHTCPVESHTSFCSPSPPPNFLWLPLTYLRPLPLAQTKLPIPC